MSISGISGMYAGAGSPTPPAQQSAPAQAAVATPTSAAAPTSVQSSSVSSSVETFMSTYGALLSNNEIVGAMLLMMTLEYLKGDKSDEEKKGLLSLIASLAQQQQQQSAGANGSSFYYSSSSTVESTEFQTVSPGAGASAYGGTALNVQQAPSADAGAGGLNVVV